MRKALHIAILFLGGIFFLANASHAQDIGGIAGAMCDDDGDTGTEDIGILQPNPNAGANELCDEIRAFNDVDDQTNDLKEFLEKIVGRRIVPPMSPNTPGVQAMCNPCFAGAIDPNAKYGLGNNSEYRFTYLELLPYFIQFENMDTATAPAAVVIITDTIDISKFNMATFQLGPVYFGDYFIQQFEGNQFENFAVVNMRQTHGVDVKVEVVADSVTGIVQWVFTSFDTVTYNKVTDPLVGFLPPNVNGTEGQGGVSYLIERKQLESGTSILNRASIVFDSEAPIITNTWEVVVDTTKPQSYILPLPSVICDTTFIFTWRGMDEHSRIAGYDIYYSEGDAKPILLYNNTRYDSSYFYGEYGRTYNFYVVAKDKAGNVEDFPAIPDAVVRLAEPSPLTYDIVEICGSYTWIDGVTYTSSTNTPTFTLTNAAGCDSLVTLNLTIKSPSTGVDKVDTCGSYTWIDGITYTSSTNTPTFTLANAAGCDSVVTLNLTINTPTTGIDIVSSCGSYTWIDGVTYTSSTNTPTFTLTNAAGCDSVVTLNLTVNTPTLGIDIVSSCGSYTWIDGITYTSSTNTPTYTLVNAAGCDSIVTLNLTINQPLSINTQPTHQTVVVGENATFSVVAAGAITAYQWRKNGIIISGETESTLTISNVSESDAGNYDVVITGPCGSIISEAGVLTVQANTITSHPQHTGVCSGANAEFSINVVGSGVTYQWQQQTAAGVFTAIPGATSSSLVLSAVTDVMNGNRYRCVINGSIISEQAILTVYALPVVSLVLPFDTLFLNSSAQALSGGLPLGGVYSGTGISGNNVVPSSLQTGNYTITYQYTTANGCLATATDEFTVLPMMNIIKLYPNPSQTGQFTMNVIDDLVGGTATVYNMKGQKITSWQVSGRHTTHQVEWPSGTYTIVILKGNITAKEQLVIVR